MSCYTTAYWLSLQVTRRNCSFHARFCRAASNKGPPIAPLIARLLKHLYSSYCLSSCLCRLGFSLTSGSLRLLSQLCISLSLVYNDGTGGLLGFCCDSRCSAFTHCFASTNTSTDVLFSMPNATPSHSHKTEPWTFTIWVVSSKTELPRYCKTAVVTQYQYWHVWSSY